MSLGVLGGTFNPIHLGHLLVAEEVRTRLDLAEVLFVPTGQPWMKGAEELAPKEHRWEMVVRATASNPTFLPSRVEIDRPGPSYSIDTLKELQRERDVCADIFFIMGADTLLGLPEWKEPRKLLELCRIAAVTRPAHDQDKIVASVARKLPELAERITFVDGLNVDISATDIRRRCKDGRSIKYRVPEAVEQYILEHRLYR